MKSESEARRADASFEERKLRLQNRADNRKTERLGYKLKKKKQQLFKMTGIS